MYRRLFRLIATCILALIPRLERALSKRRTTFLLIGLIIFLWLLSFITHSTVKKDNVTRKLPALHLIEKEASGDYWLQERVRPGDNLSRILTRLGISERHVQNMLKNSDISAKMLQLRIGQTLDVRIGKDAMPIDIQFFNDDNNGDKNLVAMRLENGHWVADYGAVESETFPTFKSVVVKTSARGALASAGVPVEIREALDSIFSDGILKKLRAGDTIRIIYNSLYFRGMEIGTADILAAEITHKGELMQAFYYDDDNQSGQYYTYQGEPIKKGFDILPVQGARVSSPYGVRLHPILRTIKMHTGIDYAAPTGTPVRAPSDGVVEEVAAKGGYGNTVVIRHSPQMQTLYAHLSRYGKFPKGSRVKTGDVIGYIGSTGRSTGSHLHYEVRINGQPVNPATSTLPSRKLSGEQLKQFYRERDTWNDLLQSVRSLNVTINSRN